ncbi:biotin/lipoyl-binding protein [Gemmatimonas sp.]|uniref:biotin/lipoyl-binding protein n=1 Tax=Gemmatimonas sp. TaxID=1962908 RepID=UPI003DA4DE0F
MSTKLMGTVTAVLVHEGDAVRSGQVLVQIDARDLNAKANQAAASIADAEAMQREAAAHAARFTALYNDSAATKAQYDAAQTGLARANAGLQAARAGASELEAVRSYACGAGAIRRHRDRCATPTPAPLPRLVHRWSPCRMCPACGSP